MSDRYWALVRALVESGQEQRRPKRAISEQITGAVADGIENDEEWAIDTLTRWCRDGADEDYTKVFKDMNTVTYIRADGSRTRKTVAYSRPMRSQGDGQIIGRQIQAWWGMSRAAIQELRNELNGQRENLGDSLAMIDRLIGAMDRHPQCTTAAEAWEADGHDLDEIDLGGVA